MTPKFSADGVRKALAVSLGLYFVASWCSMAGLEIFGWLTFTLALTYAIMQPPNAGVRALELEPYIPWKSCLLLLAITALGLAVNGTSTADPVYDIGSQRWMFLLATHSFAIATVFPGKKGYRTFLVCMGIVAVYAIFQSITGIDIMRPGSHRAVQPLNLETTLPLWRSAGFWGSPMQYGYIAGQWVCLPLAMALLTFSKRKTAGWLFWGSAIVFCLLGLSLVTTFTRGAWIAMGCAWLAVAWFVAPRVAAGLAGAGAVVTLLLFTTVDQFRVRVLSLFDMNYASNSERMFLWKANWEMFKDYPILGIGYQENETRAGEYVARLGKPDAFTGHAHNNYLQMLAGTGVVGFLTYMFIILFMLWMTWRLIKKIPSDLLWPRALAIAAFGAQIHLHIGGFTECDFKAGATNHNFMLVWAFVIALSALDAKGLLRSKNSDFN